MVLHLRLLNFAYHQGCARVTALDCTFSERPGDNLDVLLPSQLGQKSTSLLCATH